MTDQQPPAYNQPQYGAAAPYGEQKYNTLAIVGFILAFFVSLGGIIVGFIALSQIKKTGEKGRGLAIAGIIIGFVAIAFTIIYIIAAIALVASSATYTTY